MTLPTRHTLELTKALSGPNKDRVRDALNEYTQACEAYGNASETLKKYRRSIGIPDIAVWCHETKSVKGPQLTPQQIEHRAHLCHVATIAQSTHFKSYRALLVQIHGEEAVAFAEMLDRRQNRYGWTDNGCILEDRLTLQDWD